MTKSRVPWADFRWNPIEGCSAISEGCKNCYAQTLSRRFHRPWGEPVFHESRLEQPGKTRKPGRVFVCSTSDLFHDDCVAGDDWLDAIFSVILDTPRYTFLLLTKRPENIPSNLRLPPNVWLGVTAENQARADERIPILLSIPAALHFVSVEPMLGPVDLSRWLASGKLNWVIAGPETGPERRLFYPAWIDSEYEGLGIAEQCLRGGVPFFDKRPGEGRTRQFPERNP